MRNLQEQVKKVFSYQKLFWPFTIWINCSSDLKFFVNSQPSALTFKSFSQLQEQFFLTLGQNNFGNKIPFLENYKYECCFALDKRKHKNRNKKVRARGSNQKLKQTHIFILWVDDSWKGKKLGFGILLPKLLKSLEQFIQTVKVQNNFW